MLYACVCVCSEDRFPASVCLAPRERKVTKVIVVEMVDLESREAEVLQGVLEALDYLETPDQRDLKAVKEQREKSVYRVCIPVFFLMCAHFSC